jgi:hypothetical protein
MEIVNSIMPMNDIEALAANGQKLRVAATKTSAQGKAVQSTTPNLMSFSTDENSVWFNGKKYGVHLFKDSIYTLSTSSSHQDIVNALNGLDNSNIKSFVDTGVIGVFRLNESPDYYQGIVTLGYEEEKPIHMYLYITDNYYNTKYISINISTPAKYVVESVENSSLLREADVVNSLTLTSTTAPLSAAMGKKLQDEKLAKSDVVNNLTTTDASKALSAAQGKVLNDRISGLGNVYRVRGTKTNLSDVLALIDAKVGDVWSVTNAFTLGGKPYPANTNVVCIIATSSSDHDEGNWDPLGGTVDLSTYLSKNDASSTYATKSELNSHIGNKNNPHGVTKSQVGLGNVTNDAQVKKTDVVDYNLAVKVPSTSQVPSTEAFAKIANYAEMFPVSFDAIEAGEKTIVLNSTTTAGGTIVWLSTMKKFTYKGTDGKYYNNWAISGSPNPALVNAGLVKRGDNSPIPGKVYIHDSGMYFSTGTDLVLMASKDIPIIIE